MKKIILVLTSVSSFAFDAVDLGFSIFNGVSISVEKEHGESTFFKAGLGGGGFAEGSFSLGYHRQFESSNKLLRVTVGADAFVYHATSFGSVQRDVIWMVLPEITAGMRLSENIGWHLAAGGPSFLSISVHYRL